MFEGEGIGNLEVFEDLVDSGDKWFMACAVGPDAFPGCGD